jgi:hypothetical protein
LLLLLLLLLPLLLAFDFALAGFDFAARLAFTPAITLLHASNASKIRSLT